MNWTAATTAASWSKRGWLAGVVFNAKLWVLGGSAGGSQNDVWSSSDGITWSQETAAAPWHSRFGHSSAVFNNKLWVLGGSHEGGYLGDIWSLQ